MKKTLVVYQTVSGKEPLTEWLNSLDNSIRARIYARFKRVAEGNLGDHKRFYGIIELRYDLGKGYRVYCKEEGHTIVLLLTGGDKGSQQDDIFWALKYWEDYNEQKKIQNT
ncbi:MAG: type II toxin-antitoxin system RelE/ParE family toxin [Elusimicrobiota bacterium]